MSDLEVQLKRIQDKLQQLLKQHNALQKENNHLKEQLDKIKLQALQQQKNIEELKLQVNVLKLNALQFGSLTSIQMLTSIVVYIPIAKLSDKMSRKPFVLLTFFFFALYPLSLVIATNNILVVIAFIVGGLREIGEPARKAIIVDLAAQSIRGRTIGLYYLVRGLVVFPASLVGGWLWFNNPQYPFYVAFALGMIGVIVFSMWKSYPTVASSSSV